MTVVPDAADNTTDDAFLGGKVIVAQPRHGYRAGIDAVFLAAVVPAATRRVLDIGAGVGTVGLCVAARCPDTTVVLLEREPRLAALARANVARNQLRWGLPQSNKQESGWGLPQSNKQESGWGLPQSNKQELNDRVRVVEAAVGSRSDTLNAVGLSANGFDHVLANPPYHDEGRGTAAPDHLKAVSHAMPHGDLDDWVRFMARMTRAGGTATLIHKADALAPILAAFGRRFGALRILPLHPREGAPASRILVCGTKGSHAPLRLLPGFMLHGNGTAFTDAASAILRDGAGLEMGPRIDML